MKISCTNLMIPGKTLTEQAELLKKCGFDAISVFEDIDRWSPDKEAELFQIRERTGIEVCEFCFSGKDYGKLMSDSKQTAERSKDLYKRAIEVCNRIGAVTEMEFAYAAQEPLPLFHPYRKMSQEQKKRFCEIFSELAAEIQGDAKLLLEPVNRYESPFLNNLEDNIEILENVSMPGTGLLADVFHMSIEESDVCGALKRAGRWIKHVHLGDNNRLMPGKGSLNWDGVFAALKSGDYSGAVNLECACSENDLEKELCAQARFLRAHLR